MIFVNVFSDVVESDEEINPKSVICSEPLIVPAGVLSPLSETNPKAVICADELINTEPVNASNLPALCSNEEVVDSKLLNCMLS